MINGITYIYTEMLEKMPWINGSTVKLVNQLSLIKSSSDFRILSMLKLMYPLTETPLNFSSLYYKSGIRMKVSFLKYLRVCQELGFIEKAGKVRQNQYYALTDKGRLLLNLFYLA